MMESRSHMCKKMCAPGPLAKLGLTPVILIEVMGDAVFRGLTRRLVWISAIND